jgi:hypothetical protein
VFYWIAIIIGLYYNKWAEGRVTFFGRGSAAYNRIMASRARKNEEKRSSGETPEGSGSEDGSHHGKVAPVDEIYAAPLLAHTGRGESTISQDIKESKDY